MILTIKAKVFELLPDEMIKITTDCESFKESLGGHSPNILIEYLNEHWNTRIAHIDYKGKEAEHENR